MTDALKDTDVQKVVVNTTDGKQWLCEYKDGQLIPLNEIGGTSPPPSLEEFIMSPTPTWWGQSKTPPKPKDPPKPKEEKKPETPPKLPKIEDSVFRARLRSIMTDNMYDRRTRGRTRGKLDMQRLWKAKVGATNLFTQKQSRKNKNYNIVLLIDESGSMMNHNKSKYAADIACFLAKSFTGINLNLAIVGFNRYLNIHQSFSEEIKDYDKLHQTIMERADQGYSANGHGHNNDFDAMSYAYKQFNGKKGQNFLIMLSDGEPAQDNGNMERAIEDPQQFKQAILDGEGWALSSEDPLGRRHQLCVDLESKIPLDQRQQREHFTALVHANPQVASLGIGIKSDCWQIPDNFRENDLEQLKPVLLREIQKKVKRG